jgi:hypothetical protein
MTWEVEDAGDVYNVYRGGLGIVMSTGNYTQPPAQQLPERFCEFPASALPFTDLFDPSVGGTVMYYLVSRVTPAFEGSLGNDPTGILRLNAFPCP